MRKLYVFLLALLLPLTACEDDPTGTVDDALGTYTLQTIAGNALPVTVFEIGPDRLEVAAGQVALNANNAFTTSLTFRETEGGVVTTSTETANGTFARSGTAILMRDADGDEVLGTLGENTLTLNAFGQAFVFRK